MVNNGGKRPLWRRSCLICTRDEIAIEKYVVDNGMRNADALASLGSCCSWRNNSGEV